MSGSRSKKSGGKYDVPGARNYKGEESEQSKERRKRKVEKLVESESIGGKMSKERRKRKEDIKKAMER